MGINKGWDLATFDKKTVRRHFNINVEKTSRELAGEYCYELMEDVTPKQMIACTRSFSQRVTPLDGLRSAVSTFVANASRKLRAQNQYEACVQVFVRTSPFDTNGMPYARSVSIPLAYPSFDTRDLMEAALTGLQQIYIEGPKYAEAGVILSQFFDPGTFTDDLFAQPKRKNSEQRMAVLDRINLIHGRGVVRFASEPVAAPWSMKQHLLGNKLHNAVGGCDASKYMNRVMANESDLLKKLLNELQYRRSESGLIDIELVKGYVSSPRLADFYIRGLHGCGLVAVGDTFLDARTMLADRTQKTFAVPIQRWTDFVKGKELLVGDPEFGDSNVTRIELWPLIRRHLLKSS